MVGPIPPRPPGPPDEESLRELIHEPHVRELLLDATSRYDLALLLEQTGRAPR